MRVIVTATETIQGATIERYIDTICANVVLGSNAFADIGASFTDLFGGRSGIYEGKLALIYEKAKKSLIQRAQTIGANAIVGFKVDFDEISAQGKSMFMVAASGTACKVIYSEREMTTDSVSGTRLKEREAVEKAIADLKKLGAGSNSNPQRAEQWSDWGLLEVVEEPTVDFAEALIDVYRSVEKDRQELIEVCLLKLDYDVLCEIVYGKYEGNTYLYFLIKALSLFNPRKVLDLVKRGKIGEAAHILNVDKDVYTMDDLNVMREIVSAYDCLPNRWKKEVVKGGFMSKDKEMNICMCGQKNDLENEYCSKCECNGYGLTRNEMSMIGKFKRRVGILEKMIL